MHKRIIYILIVLCLSVISTSCGKVDSTTEPLLKGRFDYVETIGSSGDCDFHIIRDSETGVEYIWMNGYGRMALCPLYDSNGEIVVEKGE